jgi:hypothetical protein
MRQLLQKLPDVFKLANKYIFVDYVVRGETRVIFEDSRFMFEADRLKQFGEIFKLGIYRPGFENKDEHNSEAEMRPLLINGSDWFDAYFVNDKEDIESNLLVSGIIDKIRDKLKL